MNNAETSTLSDILGKHQADLLADWVREQISAVGRDPGKLKEAELREQSREFLSLLRVAVQGGPLDDIHSSQWDGVRGILNGLSRSRSLQGFSPSETASFVFSLKKP